MKTDDISRTKFKKAFKELLWPRRGRFALGFVLIVSSRLSGLVLPYSTKILIDDVLTQHQTALSTVLIVVGIATCIQSLSAFFLTVLLSVEAHRVIVELRTRIQRHVLRLPVSYFDSTKSGFIVSRIMNDVEGVRNLLGTGVVQLVGGVLQSIVAFGLLLNIDVTLTLLTFVPLLLFGVIAAKAFSFIRPIFRERSMITAEVTGRLTETIGGVRIIKGFSAERGEDEVFRRGALRLFENVRRSLVASSAVSSSTVFLTGVTSMIIMGYGGTLIANSSMTIGDFVAFTLILGYLVAPIFQMANIGTQITEAFAGLDKMEEMLAIPKEGDSETRDVELGLIQGELCFDHVDFAYQGGEPVLHDITFTASAGSVVALVGSSGAGKSTIAGLAAGFMMPGSGQVRIDGVDVSTVVLESFRSQLGLVLQEDFLFEGTIRENILFARADASVEELTAAVHAAYVSEFTDGFSAGLETLIGERGIKLSGGQRQRVAIARALLANPRLLILDEATSALDAESEHYIQKSFASLIQGRTTLVIAHRLSTVMHADTILVVEDGRVVERGSHAELLAAEGRYHELFQYQLRG
jgi:subfamily B ATP-binding cassette protein MsbA